MSKKNQDSKIKIKVLFTVSAVELLSFVIDCVRDGTGSERSLLLGKQLRNSGPTIIRNKCNYSSGHAKNKSNMQ